MKTKSLIAATALVILAAPALANTPTNDPFTRPGDPATQLAPDQYMGNPYTAPFGDHLRQNPMNGMRPMDSRPRNNLLPPRMDASGVPDPRI